MASRSHPPGTWRLTRYRLVIGYLLGVAVCPAALQAQSDVIQLAQRPFAENFVGNPRVSGNLLVGLHLGRVAASFDPTIVRVPVMHRSSGRTVCAHVSSRDGRYSAENLYRVPPTVGLMRLEMPTRYSSELRKFAIDDVAVVVREVTDCRSSDFGVLIPARLSSGDAVRDLIALVNPGFARAEASLSQNKRVVFGPVRCERIEDEVRIAFSTRCVMTLPTSFPSGAYSLDLTFRESTSRDTVSFSVLLP